MAYSIFEDFITKNGPFIILSKNLKFCLEGNYLFVYTLEAHFAQGVLTEKYLSIQDNEVNEILIIVKDESLFFLSIQNFVSLVHL
jgi:hypothetical protein